MQVAEETQAPYVANAVVVREFDLKSFTERLEAGRAALQEVLAFLANQDQGQPGAQDTIEIWRVHAALSDFENLAAKAQKKAQSRLRVSVTEAAEIAMRSHDEACRRIKQLAACVVDEQMRDKLLTLAEYEGE